ncbi:uncharacterized protein LOC124890729 isoform X1 [Capsicum annuum]|uniref:uncharacterized protein LOC124890729 isoform X1 n=1 Tax=Capsicum annuum TaxID=4072 RepID=UPI001FB0ED27|nr:uncharacterized protein LOC124890729 isoform X1 [Capsicum annuum]
MAIHQTPTLAPALPQPHSKESKNDMSPPNIVFQQQNLPFSFSRQNPETVGSLVVVVGAIAEPSKKKRGRPRKIIADGNTGITGATLENPSKKVQLDWDSTMRTIYVNTGEIWIIPKLHGRARLLQGSLYLGSSIEKVFQRLRHDLISRV